MELLLGIDVGTTGCKSGLYDINGRLVNSSYREYKIISPRSGWAEENPDEWWLKTSTTINECIEKLNLIRGHILGVCVSCTNSLVPVDNTGSALYNGIMQIDSRTGEEVARIKNEIGEEKIFAITGNRIAEGTFSAPSILWIRKNRPEIYSNTYKFLTPSGFIVNKLTGKFSIDYTRASTTLLFDIRKRQWSEELCHGMGISVGKLPEVYSPDFIVGRVTKEASAITGLAEGTPVTAGIMDTAAAAIGMGVTKADDPFLVIGTVSRISVGLKESRFDKRFLNTCFTTEIPWLARAPNNGGGISLRWFMDTFGESERILSGNTGISAYKFFDMEASRINPGSDGLIYLPYIAGERSPIWDAFAKGVFFGISTFHTKGHFIRSIMEGTAYAAKNNLEILCAENAYGTGSIKIGGGGALSSLWRDIMSQVLGKTVLKPKVAEAETLGSAIIAGKAAGVLNRYDELSDKMEIESEAHPVEEVVGLYDKYFNLYKQLYAHLKYDYQHLQSILGNNSFV